MTCWDRQCTVSLMAYSGGYPHGIKVILLNCSAYVSPEDLLKHEPPEQFTLEEYYS